MLKILSGDQVKNLDSIHVQKQQISSLELMERAALAFVKWWMEGKFEKVLPVFIFCGAGNNGGDGFAIARILFEAGFEVKVFTCFSDLSSLSLDANENFKRLPKSISIHNWKEFDSNSCGILIDCFLGVGLKGDLRSDALPVINRINQFGGKVVSVDIPSGLPSEDLLKGLCVKSNYTVTFAFPKLSLLLPEHADVTGELVLVDIDIADAEYDSFESPYYFLRENDVPSFHRKFHRFSHKGDFGKVLLVAGSVGKMGAAILSSKASLRTGSGLVTVLTPSSERQILQISVPEAMVTFNLSQHLVGFDAIGIGPGLGVKENVELVRTVFSRFQKPIVIDADAITILAENPDLLSLIPKGSILTPHLKEFDRLMGKSSDHLNRLRKASDFCAKWELNLVIKGANSVICLADRRQIFNSSGSQYMATGGSGDVLTGMIASFLGQGYSPEQAMICGVFQHGLAGEIAGEIKRRGMIASDLIEAIPETFVHLDIS